MDKLTVTPEYLEDLAIRQDEAAQKSSTAAGATSGIDRDVSHTHGVISDASNHAIACAEEHRRAAAKNIAAASTALAAKLRAIEETYSSADEELAGQIARQLPGPS